MKGIRPDMNEFNMGFVMDRLVRGWRTCTLFAALAVLLVLFALPFQQVTYSVRMTVVPAPNEQNVVSVSGSALTTLLGLGVGGAAQSSNYIRYQKLLVSNVVAQQLQNKYGMVQYVFSSYWDAQNRKWNPPNTIRGFMVGWLLALAHVPQWSAPDVTALAAYLNGHLLIVPSTESDLVTISMDGPDVNFSRRVMLAAHEQANQVLRDQVARRARQQVAYLQSKIAETTVEDYRLTLLTILSSEEKTLMLTQTNASFAAEILSPPMASPTPVSPRPVLSVFVAALVGILLGSIVVIFFGPEWWQETRQRIAAFGGARGTSGR
ncbi:MAG TPA: hypothetical protein VNW15_04915 [Rhizomicrobium sp.]|nr:hypothetical protein [Rhizomicrobium sp.]